jgi:ubiquinone/menaquinone biosynthesis C-methylase UbiE
MSIDRTSVGAKRGPARNMGAIRDVEFAGWRSAAAAYEACFAGATRPYVDALLDAAGARGGTRVLDIACGTGVAAAEAARRGAQAFGVDFSPEMLAEARKLRRDVDFHEGDAEHLPFDEGTFDVAISNFGIHHCERPQDAIAEAHRVLRPGGRFAFTVWVKPKDNAAWRLVHDAVVAHGRLDVAMPAGSDAHHTLQDFVALVGRGGFGADDVAGTIVDRTWAFPAGADLVSMFEHGTVRMATLLRGQSPQALRAIRAHVTTSIQSYAGPNGIEVPTRAFMVRARKTPLP